MKLKVGYNCVTHRQEERRNSAVTPTFSALSSQLSGMSPLWKAPVQMSGSTTTHFHTLTNQPGLKVQNKELAEQMLLHSS